MQNSSIVESQQITGFVSELHHVFLILRAFAEGTIRLVRSPLNVDRGFQGRP
jgi:hypothetical protein